MVTGRCTNSCRLRLIRQAKKELAKDAKTKSKNSFKYISSKKLAQ